MTINRDTEIRAIRVVWAFPSFVRGYYWQPVLKEFVSRFPNTTVITGAWPGFLPQFEHSFQVQVRARIRWVTWKWGDRQIAFTWSPASVFAELLRLRPDVLVTSGFNIFTLFGLLLKVVLGTRIVMLWEGISPTIACRNAPFRLGLRRLLARFVDGIVCNSREGANYLHEVLQVPKSRLISHPYEVPESAALETIEGPPSVLTSLRRPVFLNVGQLIPRKGWRHLLDAARHLLDKGIDSFSIVFVGQGVDQAELGQMAKSLGLSEVVHLLGQVPYRELGAHFRAADVFVFPTMEDVWGMVVLEAMTFGKPLLCSHYAGSKELVRENVNGFIFEPRKPEELAEYMQRFIQDPELIERFGQQSKEIIASYTPRKGADVISSIVMKAVRSNEAQKPLGGVELTARHPLDPKVD